MYVLFNWLKKARTGRPTFKEIKKKLHFALIRIKKIICNECLAYSQIWEWKTSHLKSGVDFIKVGRMAQIIEIALSSYALRLHPFTPIFWEAFYWRKSSGKGVGDKKSLWNRPPAANHPPHCLYPVLIGQTKKILFFC